MSTSDPFLSLFSFGIWGPHLQYESDWQMFISSIPEHQQAELEKARRSQFTKGRTISTVGIKVGFPVSSNVLGN